MNNNQKLIAGTFIGLGILGLGTLAYYLLSEDETEETKEAISSKTVKKGNKQPKPVKTKENSYKDKDKEAKARKGSQVPKETIKAKESLPTPIADEFPLRLGSKGKRVERLQIWMMRNFGMFGIINDEFDQELEKMVSKRFKRPFVSEEDYYSRKMEKSVKQQGLLA